MAFHPLVFVGIATLLYFGNKLVVFYNQYRAVKQTGIPFTIIPFLHYETLPRMLEPLWRPLHNALPDSWRGKWALHLDSEYTWRWLHHVFREMGSDTFMVVTLTGRSELITSDPDVILQITSRKNDFWKPTDVYRIMDVYGKNVLSVEGQIWKRHRKVVGPPFTERNNRLVWSEALHSSQAMIDSLLNHDGSSTRTVDDLMPLISRLALSIISKAGYGVRLNWPGRDGKAVSSDDDTSSDPVLNRDWVEGKTNGHTMSFDDAIYNTSHYLIPILLVPGWLLKRLPFKATKTAASAYWNWGNYMREMIVAKKKHVGDIEPGKQSYDLLANLVKSAADSSTLLDNEKAAAPGQKAVGGFTDDEILGNSFLLIIAGHETSAGALQHLTIMLAMNLAPQRQLQKEIDGLFGDMPPSQWDYERDFPRIFGGMPGAILAETLRIIPPALSLPKLSKHETNLNVNGRTCRIPGNTPIGVNVGAAHRNPKYWPHEKHDPDAPIFAGLKSADLDTDLSEFKPSRWLLDDDANGATNHAMPEAKLTAEEQALGVNLAADNAPTLMKPFKGAYLPFMEGHRACMGRRFAQVEIMAIMAAIFQKYSVELAVDEWASDAEVDRMSKEEKKALWRKARAAGERKFATSMNSIITIAMRKDKVPVRFVRRGEERFPVDLW